MEKGTLIVSVTTLRGTYPVPNAVVTVFSGDYSKDNEIIKAVTDESGKTQPIILDAKDKSLSETQGNPIPYTTYSIYTTAPEFLGQFNMNIPIFSGVVSLQSVDLVPLGAEGNNGAPRVVEEAPKFNL